MLMSDPKMVGYKYSISTESSEGSYRIAVSLPTARQAPWLVEMEIDVVVVVVVVVVVAACCAYFY